MRDLPPAGSPWSSLTRRRAVTLGVGAFVVASVPLGIAARRRRAVAHRRTLPVMGTIADLVVVSDDRGRAMAALDAACSELRAVDTLMSRYAATSDVGRLNTAAGRAEPVVVASTTAEVLRAAQDWAARSAGAFDPCVGRAVAAWDPKTHSAPPPAATYERLAGAGLWRALEVDAHRGRSIARLTNDDAAVDLGGIAKGYAVDRAIRTLRSLGIESGFVNAGGDLAAIGRSADGDAWTVGVRDPHDPSALCATLRLEDAALATSGDYENAFSRGERTYHHILDPRTAQPRATTTHSLTIRAPDCMSADAAATALFGADAATTHRTLTGTGAEVVTQA